MPLYGKHRIRPTWKSASAKWKRGLLRQAVAKAQAVWKGQESKRFQFLGSFTAEAGFFFVHQGRYLKDSDREGSIRGQAMLGVTATFGVEMTTQISAFFLSAGLSLSVSAAGMLGVEMGVSWKDNGWPSLHNLKLDTGTSGMSVMIRLQIGFAAGIGAKNVPSISINGYGYISFLVMLTGGDQYLRVSAGGRRLSAGEDLLCKVEVYDLEQRRHSSL